MSLDVIGIDASRAHGDARTGTEWYSFEIIRALSAIEERPRLRLYHRKARNQTGAKRVEHVAIHRRRLWTHTGLAAEMRGRPPDALFVPAHVVPPAHPRATVVTIHDLGYRFEPRAHSVRRRLELDVTTRWNAHRAARIIVPSRQTRDDLARAYGVDSGRIDVIPHGLDHERFRELDPEVSRDRLAELGLNQPYLVFLSTIQPRKNVSRLIAAFEALAVNGLTLVIAGKDGWLSDGIRRRTEASARSNAIVRLGYVADDDVPVLYNGASAFVLPSLYEGFGMGVLEAMACGCPVVASARSSLPEVAGGAAILVDPDSVGSIRDGIAIALDGDQARRLRHAGLKRAREFTWDRAARRTLATIQRAYDESAG